MKRVAIYMRVSTALQEEEQTIENQKMEILARIKNDSKVSDLILVPNCEYKDEGWSGAIIERPALDQMRADARDKKFDILYAYDRGRVSRKFVHQEIILEELKECGVEFISLHDINGQTTEEVLMGSVMGIFHEYERVKITERMRIGKVRKVRENKKLLGYNPKYGYDYNRRIKSGPDARDGYFTINKKQAKIVRQIFQWVADGYSKHEVKRMLFEAGILPPKAKREQWSGGTIDRMLRDTTYIGEHYYNKSESVPTRKPRNPEQKYRKVVKGSRSTRPKEEWLLVKVPPIIERGLFEKVQKQIEINKRLNQRNNGKNNYLISGLIECPCGKARTGDPANGSLYYRCTDRLNKYPLPRTCYEGGINVPVLDSLVWKEITSLLSNPELIQHHAERWTSSASPLKAKLEQLNTRLEKLEDEERRYTKAYGKALMSERLYKDNFHETSVKRSELMTEISNTEAELAGKPQVPVEKLIDGVLKLVGNLDFTDKKQLIQKLVTKVVATKQEITIWGHIPILATEQVGLNAKYRDSRSAECWEVDAF